MLRKTTTYTHVTKVSMFIDVQVIYFSDTVGGRIGFPGVYG
tara:strand:- start:1115 stop:1237 length:123 start_codon:yes stop_codon:yes gene_type:complete